MTPEDIARILDDLGQRIGPAGEYVFQLAVRQVVITSAVGIVSSIVVLAVTGLTLRWAIGFTKRRWDHDVARYAEGKGRWSSIQSGPDMADYGFAWAGPAIVFLVVGIGAFLTLTSSVISLLNPEYQALIRLLEAIR